jgi:transketolase
MVNEAVLAHEELKSEGINVRVINMSTIKPIDKELIIKAAKETKAIITAEEHSVLGGLGSAVSEVVCEECPVIVKKIGVNDVFGESGTPAELLEKHGLTAKNLVKTVKETLK